MRLSLTGDIPYQKARQVLKDPLCLALGSLSVLRRSCRRDIRKWLTRLIKMKYNLNAFLIYI